MPKTSRQASIIRREIAEKASRREDISAHFTNKFTVVKPVQRANVDLTQGMLRELDQRAARLNVSRQAVDQDASRSGTEGGCSGENPIEKFQAAHVGVSTKEH